jgi:hypothetical protein
MLHQGSKAARAMRKTRLALVTSLGGDLSPQEEILLDRVLAKNLKCLLAESAMLAGEKPDEAHYLALANSLRLDLQALGLKRRLPKDLSLKDYLRKQAG